MLDGIEIHRHSPRVVAIEIDGAYCGLKADAMENFLKVASLAAFAEQTYSVWFVDVVT